MAREAGIAPRPEKREKRRPKGEDYTDINLSTLTRFEIFVRDMRSSQGPISFRSHMKGSGSHRTMALTVDRIEKLSEQLLIRREILDEHGKRVGREFVNNEGKLVGRYITDYEGLKEKRTKRPNGINPRDITPHGEVWVELSRLINDLFDMAMDKTLDPKEVQADIRDARDFLSRIRDRPR